MGWVGTAVSLPINVPLHERGKVSAVGVHVRRVLPEGERRLALALAVGHCRSRNGGGERGVAFGRRSSGQWLNACWSTARGVPVGSRLPGGSTEVEPRLAVGARSMVAHTAVVVDLPSVEGSATASLRTVVAGASSGTAAVTTGTHEGAAVGTVDLSEGVDVLQLRAANVARMVATGVAVVVTTTAVATTATTSTTATTAVVERRVLTLKLGLDALAVGSVADGRENGADSLDELRSVSYTALT